MQETQTQKKVVSVEQFEKKVEIEAAHLEYMDRLSRPEAQAEARRRISQEYVKETET